MELPALVTLIAIAGYMFLTMRVGLGRAKFGILGVAGVIASLVS